MENINCVGMGFCDVGVVARKIKKVVHTVPDFSYKMMIVREILAYLIIGLFMRFPNLSGIKVLQNGNKS